MNYDRRKRQEHARPAGWGGGGAFTEWLAPIDEVDPKLMNQELASASPSGALGKRNRKGHDPGRAPPEKAVHNLSPDPRPGQHGWEGGANFCQNLLSGLRTRVPGSNGGL